MTVTENLALIRAEWEAPLRERIQALEDVLGSILSDEYVSFSNDETARDLLGWEQEA